MKLQDTHTNEESNFIDAVKTHIRNGAVLVAVVFILFAVFGSDVISRVATSTVTPRVDLLAAATAANNTTCEDSADVTIGFGGLGTGVIKCLSDGVCAALQSIPNSKHYGCMIVGCRDRLGEAVRYVQQQQQAAGRPITVDIVGHSAGADGTTHLVSKLAGNPNIRIRNIVIADPTPLASAIPAGVGQVTNLVSSWDSASCMRSASPTTYVNRPDLNHLQIDNLIPQYLGCKNKEVAQKCITGDEEECRNKCSTTYVDIDAATAKPATTDCYEKNAGKDGAAKNLILKLEQCVNTSGGSASESTLKKALCITTREVKQNGTTGEIELTKEKEQPIKIPAKCAPIVKQIEELRKGANAQDAAQKSDIGSCTWKGAVQCYPDPSNLAGGKFICKKKIDGQDTPGGDQKPAPTNNNDALRQCVQTKLGSPTTSIFGGGSPTSSSGNNGQSSPSSQNQANQCPTGYTQSKSADGKIVCTQTDKKDDGTSTTAKPQCLLVASKEEVVAGTSVQLQWRTANAERVTITNVEGSVNTSGSTVVRPAQSTTYTLTATGKGTNNTKTCDVQVKVTGSSTEGPSGDFAPKMSCTPDVIKKGSQAQVAWECPAEADEAVGKGITTSEKVRGTVLVSPTYNTQYEVMCKKDNATIGENSCIVRVGEPAIELLASASSISDDENVRISWGSLFMKSCRVEGPRGFSYSNTRGIVITQPFSASMPANVTAATYTASCTSEFGDAVTKEITVRRAR